MANSVYDDQFLTDDQRRQVEAFKAEWERANAAGDQAGMDAAHAAAERVRAQQGYSGGEDGGGYIELGSWESGLLSGGGPARLRAYEPQTDAVNKTYDEALRAQIAGLKSAYEESAAAARRAKEAVPAIYQGEKNALAAQSETAERNFNEYAAGTGLASGAQGQARLAMENARQAGLSELGRQEASALAGAESAEAELKRAYQDGIAKAVADGAYERAAALLEEYRKAAQSAVTVSGDQADEVFRWRQQMAKEIDEAAARLRKQAGTAGA